MCKHKKARVCGPFKNSLTKSALGELGSLAGFLEAVLATFLGPRVAAEVAFSLEGLAVVRGEITEGTG